MKLVSFNINGIRAHLHQLHEIIIRLNPDILGLQEIKVQNNLFPVKDILKHNYYSYYCGQKQYHGVAFLFRNPPFNILHNFSNHYKLLFQKRIIIAEVNTSIGKLTIFNIYSPQGENKNNLIKFSFKKNFYQSLYNYIVKNYSTNSLLIIMGDMNICPTDLDIGIDQKQKKYWLASGKCSFLPEEKKWINHLMNWGLIDIHRYIYPDNNQYFSWFSYQHKRFYKNKGLRIDLILITKPLVKYYKKSGICYKIRKMPKPSDHVPIWIDFNF